MFKVGEERAKKQPHTLPSLSSAPRGPSGNQDGEGVERGIRGNAKKPTFLFVKLN